MGDQRLTPEAIATLHPNWEVVAASNNWSAATIFLRALEKTTDAGFASIPADDWDSMQRRVLELIMGYKNNCGYDINNLILSEPMDGNEHTAPCPGCGNAVHWFAATYEVTEA